MAHSNIATPADFAHALKETPSPDSSTTGGTDSLRMTRGKVLSCQWGTPPTLTCAIGGDPKPIPGVTYLDSYLPSIGETVSILVSGHDHMVMGAYGSGGFDTGPIPAATNGIRWPDTAGTLPQTGSALEIDCFARSDSGGANDRIMIQFNGDGGANYEYEMLLAAGTASGTGSGIAVEAGHNTYGWAGYSGGNTSPTKAFTVNRIVIPNYTDKYNDKGWTVTGSIVNAYVVGSFYLCNIAGAWHPPASAAITSVALGLLSGGKFVYGSRFVLRIRP